jgi:hypothetical protein
MEVPHYGWFISWKIHQKKWMRTGDSPILGNPHGDVDHSCDIKLPEATKFRSIPMLRMVGIWMMDDGRLMVMDKMIAESTPATGLVLIIRPTSYIYIYMAKLQGI